MSFETKSSGRSSRWASRKVVGTVLGVAVVVGSAATAHASVSAGANGDGFLGRPKMTGAVASAAPHYSSTAPSMSSHPMNGYAYDDDHEVWNWWGGGANKWEFRTIGDQADPTFNQLLGINDSGTIVGYYGSGEDDKHPNKGYWTTPMYNMDDFEDLNYPGSVQTQVVGVGADGTAVGFYVDKEGDNHGFVYRDHDWEKVKSPWSGGGKTSFDQLLGINSAGIAAGFYNDANDNSHAYLYDTWHGKFWPITLPVHAKSVTATGINRKGQVVGFFTVGDVTKGFVWSRHSFEVISLGNNKNTQVLGINEAGSIVGSFVDRMGRTHGFVRDHMKIRQVDAPWSTSTVVNGINNKGQIVGFFMDKKENTVGFLAHR